MLSSLFFLLLFSVSLAIPITRSLSQVQTGSFIFQRTNSNQTLLFMWQYSNAFDNVPQLAFAPRSFLIEDSNQTAGFDLVPQAVTKTGVIVSWLRQISKWSSMTINYIASNRSDLILGYYHLNFTVPTVSDFDVLLPATVTHLNTTIARVYLTGCDALQLIDCGVTGSKMNQTTLTVSAYVASGLLGAHLSFSYIIFSPPTASFSSYGGMIDHSNFKGQNLSSVRKIIYKTNYLLYGFSILGLNVGGAQKINSEIDEDMVLSIYSDRVVTKFRFVYIAIGLTSRDVCTTLVYPYEWQKECVSVCPSNTFVFKYGNGGMSCNGCSDRLNLVLGSSGCVCKDGYVMTEGSCVKIVPKASSDAVGSSGQQTNMDNLLQLFKQMESRISTTINSNGLIKSDQKNSSGINSVMDKNKSDGSSTISNSNSVTNPINSMQQSNNAQSLTSIYNSFQNNQTSNSTSTTSSSTNSTTSSSSNLATTLNIPSSQPLPDNSVIVTPVLNPIADVVSNTNGAPIPSNTLNSVVDKNTQTLSTFSSAQPYSAGPNPVINPPQKSGMNSINSIQQIPILQQAQQIVQSNIAQTPIVQSSQQPIQQQSSNIGQQIPMQTSANISPTKNLISSVNTSTSTQAIAVQSQGGFSNPVIFPSSQQGSQDSIQIPIQTTTPTASTINTNSNQVITSPSSNSNTITPNYITQPSLMTSNPVIAQKPLIQSQQQNVVLSQGFNVVNPSSCPPNSYLVSGKCFCLPGYSNISGNCIKSDSVDSTDLITLQTNSNYNSNQVSNPLYPNNQLNYYNHSWTPNNPSNTDQNSCPHSSHSCQQSGTNQCSNVCVPPMLMTADGICKCPIGYVPFNKGCIYCSYPATFDYSVGKCLYFCGQFSIYDERSARCVCQNGYGVIAQKKCGRCPFGSFLKDGYCLQCADGKQLDGKGGCVCGPGNVQAADGSCISRCGQFERYLSTSGSCECQIGLGRVSGRCSLCSADQRVDANGVCGPCPAGQVLVMGRCGCASSSVFIGGACITCSQVPNSFLFQGVCASCAPGYSKDNGHCSSNSQSVIRSVASSPWADNAVASKIPVCGNGMIEQLQQCDDRNVKNGDGCNEQCQIESGWTCTRMPSQCIKASNNSTTNKNTSPNVTGDTRISGTSTGASVPKNSTLGQITGQIARNGSGSASSGLAQAGLALYGSISGNSNQIFLTLDTGIAFDFPDSATMLSFLKSQIKDCRPPTIYFSQRGVPNKNLFDVLIIFPSGIPNNKFTGIFSYSYKGYSASVTVGIDPLSIANSFANAKSSSRERGNSRV